MEAPTTTSERRKDGQRLQIIGPRKETRKAENVAAELVRRRIPGLTRPRRDARRSEMLKW
jgi:hypothetical protein